LKCHGLKPDGLHLRPKDDPAKVKTTAALRSQTTMTGLGSWD
jgi:hypothetical protein